MRKQICFFGCLALFIFGITTSISFAQPRDMQWFRSAKFGVFVHFLGGGDQWNDQVNAFNPETFAYQVKQTGAGYVIFTLGQNSGYYCSPNAAYEKYAGYQAGERCSKRDLPMELADALAKHNIRLMLYLPSRSPQTDKKAMEGLGDVDQQEPAPQVFTQRWSDVIQEWSLRYGTKVSGWWFDGAYNTKGWDDLSQPYNWNTWAAACRAGNPNSILAFNRGVGKDISFIRQCAAQDYTAGEENTFVPTPFENPAPADIQWHILSYLGTWWSKADGPKYNDKYMIDYVKKVKEQGGIVSIDVNVQGNEKIFEPHFQQLLAIGKSLKP